MNDKKTLLECFRDFKSTATDEEKALQLLSQYPRHEQVRKIRDGKLRYYGARCTVKDHDYNSSLLHHACRNGWNGVSRMLVDTYLCDPHLKNSWKYTPLHCACEGGSVDIVRFLVVDHHCDPACCGLDGKTPLHIACGSKIVDVVKFLVEECHCDLKVQDGSGDTPLHCACNQGSIDIVRFLVIDHHCDPTCCGEEGKTPLHYACESGKLDFVKFLLEECHCDPEVRDWDGHTPLHFSCGRGSIDTVRYLIVDHHCDPACRGRWGRTPLHWACKHEQLDIVKFLVEECHCDPRVPDDKDETPLHYACNQGSMDIVRLLIVDYHCDPACRGRWGRTPLHIACENGKLDLVKFFVDKCRCDPTVQDKYGCTPLHCACKGGRIDIVRFLIVDHHCDPVCCGRWGKTPLHVACVSGNLEIVKFLVEDCHCDPSVQDKNGDTPLHRACEQGSIDIVKFLIIDHHCDPACHGWQGRTPLHWACNHEELDIVKFLVEECRCDPRVQDMNGYTPLHYACNWGSVAIARFLIVDYHCDPACRGEEGRTALHSACESGKLGYVKFLVEECHCNSSLQDDNGCTPLHCACKGGSIDIVRFLVGDYRCETTCCDRWDRTPLHYACVSGKLDVVKFLVEEYHCDPRVRDVNGRIPLHCACEGGSVGIVRFLVVDHHCDPACREWEGRTPLHWACESGKLGIVKFLVEKCHCDPFNEKDCKGLTPFHLATWGGHGDVLLFLFSHVPPLKLVNSILKCSDSLYDDNLLEAFKTCWTEYPLESAFKIFVLGNPCSGKSTLVKIIENNFTSYFGSVAGKWRNISKSVVMPLTAGIIPVSIKSRKLGQIVIYDMAGHHEYYSSHTALLNSLVPSSALFLLVVSLNQERKDIICQLQFWKSFIHNYCSSSCDRIVVFSHADEVTDYSPERQSSEIMEEMKSAEACSLSEFVTLDCRKLASPGLTKIYNIVAGYCATFRQSFRFDFGVRFLYAFISCRLADKIACTVSELQSLIKQEQSEDSLALKMKGKEILPTDTNDLLKYLTSLSEKGEFILLKNACKFEDSWLVIDKAVLLSEITGTIFAPENFKQHQTIANSTGVVPFSKIREAFPLLDPDMVVAFLKHLDFCLEIPVAEVFLISSRHFRVSSGSLERFFFFPALVNEVRPSEVSKAHDILTYMCGWTLQCSRHDHFLTTRFLHVLLLRLAFSFTLHPDDMLELESSPVLQRRCLLWRNGIRWLNRDGCETTVEVVEQNRSVILIIRCIPGKEMACVEHRSRVINCILEARKEFCPAVTINESLIHPNCLTTPLIGNLFPLSDLARALLKNAPFLICCSGLTCLEINQLLYFEPYTCFSVETLRQLFAESESKLVSEVFLNKARKFSNIHVDQLKTVLSIDRTRFEAALAETPPFQRDKPEYQCKLLFQMWKESTLNPTYGALRSLLDKYSIFCGRNLLVSCIMLGIARMTSHI